MGLTEYQIREIKENRQDSKTIIRLLRAIMFLNGISIIIYLLINSYAGNIK